MAMRIMRWAASLALAASVCGPALAPPAAGRGVAPAPAADGPYAGAGSAQRFYDLDRRIDHLQGAIDQGALPRNQARRAGAQLSAIRKELKFRIARKHGQLLDWDRELITQKLDTFASRYPALAGAPG